MPDQLHRALAPLLLALAAACSTPPDPAPVGPPGVDDSVLRAASVIDADGLRGTVERLASDEFEGRGPASAGDAKTQDYLSSVLAEMGYSPGGPGGGWLQPFDVVSLDATAPKTWSFSGPGGRVALARWDDFIAFSGVQAPSAAVENAELLFVGYGIQAPEFGWDDYKGLDVSGKMLLMLNNDPDWDPDLFAGERRLYYGRWTYKYEIARQLGAAGAIIIHTTPSAGYPYQVVQTSWTGPQFDLPAEGPSTSEVEAWVTEDAAARLTALGGHDLADLVAAARSRGFQPTPLGVTTSLRLDVAVSRTRTANVAGFLEGSDSKLRDEVVVLTAHHDHFGIGQPDASGDTIYNGALDNAAGVAQVVAVARSIRALPAPPRRSILVLFVAAEEQGLLGSAFYAGHPTVDPGRIAADLNLDGGNIWGRTRDVTYIGYGKSSLDAVVEGAAALQHRTVRGDQFPDRGFFYRSDQFNFARIGVPAIYLDTGTDFIGRPPGWGQQQIEAWEASQYHQPSDEVDETWNWDGMVEDAQLAFYCAMTVAQADAMPTWNPGDEFEAARLEALAAP
jgi:Zn-dependent M28 family amino/carboxypeptidase